MRKFDSRIYKLKSLVLSPASLSPIACCHRCRRQIQRFRVSARSLITEFESDIHRAGLDFSAFSTKEAGMGAISKDSLGKGEKKKISSRRKSILIKP